MSRGTSPSTLPFVTRRARNVGDSQLHPNGIGRVDQPLEPFFESYERRSKKARRQVRRGGRWLRHVHNQLALLIVLIVGCAPIPLASNRPVFWAFWAALIFFVAGAYFAMLTIAGLKLRRPFRETGLIGILSVVFIAYALFQTLPVVPLLPERTAEFLGLTGESSISQSRSATLLASLRWASYALFFLLVLQIAEHRTRARRMAWALFLIVTAYAVFGFISYRMLGDTYFWGPKTAYVGYVTGTFVNRNSFATFLGFGAILGCTLLLHETIGDSWIRSRRRFFSVEALKLFLFWLCLLLILAALVSTGSRMGIVATFLGLMVACVFTLSRRNSRTGLLVLTVVVAISFVSIGLLAAFGSKVLDRSIFSGAALRERAELYAQTIGLIRERPLVGHGLDSFETIFEQIHRPPVSPDLVWSRAHSTYLAHWAEMGLVFGSVPLLICAVLAITMMNSIRNRSNDYALQIAGLGALVLAALHSLVDFSLEMPANVFLLMTLMALAWPSARRKPAKSDASAK